MQLISTTELRTRSKDLVASLLLGNTTELVHRSRIIGEVKPKTPSPKVFSKADAEELEVLINKSKHPLLSDNAIDRKYRERLENEYGQSIP